MIEYAKACFSCGHPNAFRASNTYTPIRLRSKCVECQKPVIFEKEKDLSYLYENGLEETVEARKVSMGRRAYGYRRTHR